MTAEQWLEKLAKEGYENLHIREVNTKGEISSEHTHVFQTAHLILRGEVTLIDTRTITLKKDDYYEIPAQTTHKIMTPETGCTLIVGEKPS